MIIGWAINSAMILMAAAILYQGNGHSIDDIHLAGSMLTPLLGNAASIIFALALLLAGISSSITAGMAGGTIFSGIFDHPYDIHHKDTKLGVLITMIPATLIILLIKSPFDGLIYSPDVFGSSTSYYDLYSDLSDILKESHGEICEFETIKDHTFYDCTERNIS